jgi:DNA segregation ATPase FtsK/SpoIIIE, S-DNA-T family
MSAQATNRLLEEGGDGQAEDSSNLVDSPAAAKLGQNRALFFSEEQGRAEKFRPYGLPHEEWLAAVGKRLRSQ